MFIGFFVGCALAILYVLARCARAAYHWVHDDDRPWEPFFNLHPDHEPEVLFVLSITVLVGFFWPLTLLVGMVWWVLWSIRNHIRYQRHHHGNGEVARHD